MTKDVRVTEITKAENGVQTSESQDNNPKKLRTVCGE